MAKVFYTERDIEDLARQGVKSLDVNDNVVVTDLAREKARKLGLELITKRPNQTAQSPGAQAAPAAPMSAKPAPAKGDLESRVFSSVKARLGDQVDDAVLHTIVERVIKGLGGK
jgi:hypothetical protein